MPVASIQFLPFPTLKVRINILHGYFGVLKIFAPGAHAPCPHYGMMALYTTKLIIDYCLKKLVTKILKHFSFCLHIYKSSSEFRRFEFFDNKLFFTITKSYNFNKHVNAAICSPLFLSHLVTITNKRNTNYRYRVRIVSRVIEITRSFRLTFTTINFEKYFRTKCNRPRTPIRNTIRIITSVA